MAWNDIKLDNREDDLVNGILHADDWNDMVEFVTETKQGNIDVIDGGTASE
jgi:hypothetical protein